MGGVRLHLTGGDGFGWALDEDIETFRRSLPAQVELVGLKDADVVYSPWWRGIAHLGSEALIGKRVLCGFDNPLYHWITQPEFRGIAQLVGLWVAHTSQALQQARSLGLECRFVPYALRTDIFHPPDQVSFDRGELRRSLGLPPDAYVIGNFQRDSEGFDLALPKLQKGPDVFAEICRELKKAGSPIHVLLAGPRRHWLRAKLEQYEVPFTYVGKGIARDDLKANLLPRSRLNELYHALDLYLLTSRWEGGPYALLEAAGTRCPLLSTPCGIAEDLLERDTLFTNAAEAVARIRNDIEHRTLAHKVDAHYRRLEQKHTTAACWRLCSFIDHRCDEDSSLFRGAGRAGGPASFREFFARASRPSDPPPGTARDTRFPVGRFHFPRVREAAVRRWQPIHVGIAQGVDATRSTGSDQPGRRVG